MSHDLLQPGAANYCIYALVDPRTSEVRYIGLTGISAQERFYVHLAQARRGDRTHKTNWLRQLLTDGLVPSIVILSSGLTQEEAVEEEKLAIASYPNLTNVSSGGQGGSTGVRRSSETKEKIRKALMGHPVSDATRQRMSDGKRAGAALRRETA